MIRSARYRTPFLLAALSISGGCALPPRSNPEPGRIEVTQTTRGDVYSPEASMPDLYRFSDEVGRQLALEIAQIREIRESPQRVVIELGTLNNRTGTTTQDFELIQRRLFGKLQQSLHLERYAMVVEQRRTMERDYREITGSDETVGEGAPEKYDPDRTYVLQGHFFESRRGGTRRYLFEFQLANLGSRAIVFNRTFDSSKVLP